MENFIFCVVLASKIVSYEQTNREEWHFSLKIYFEHLSECATVIDIY